MRTQASSCNNNHYRFFWHPFESQGQLWWATGILRQVSPGLMGQGLCLGLGLCRRPWNQLFPPVQGVCMQITWGLVPMQISSDVGLGWGLRFCVSTKTPGEAHVAGPRTTLWLTRPNRSPSVVLERARDISITWILLVLPVLRLHPRPAESETLGWGRHCL